MSLNPKKKGKLAVQDVIKVIETILPASLIKLVESQVHLFSTPSKNGYRYSSDMKAFAITLYHLNGRAYKMLSKHLRLPSKTTIVKWLNKLPNSPGLTEPAMNVISSRVKNMNDKEKLCIILFDEMSLKSHLVYITNKDVLIGLQDYGDGEKTSCLATSAIVFMARGSCENWKQPLAYFLVNEACNSEMVKEKLFQIIDKVENIGLSVLAVVCDIGSNFQKLFRELNLDYENPSFLRNGKKILFLFDAPHIIKAIRNNLMKYDFHFGDRKFASWKDIQQLYEIDSKNDICCRPKLTQSHLFPNNFQKMKVKLATQVLSHTVSSAMCTGVSTGQLPSRAAATAEFIETIDQIFDSLNSSSFESPKNFNKPITQDFDHCKFMKEMSTFVQNIKVKDRSNGKDVTNTLKCLNAMHCEQL